MAEIRASVLTDGLLQIVSVKILFINKDKACDFLLLEFVEIIDVVYNGY
jgi:hypothetical protein